MSEYCAALDFVKGWCPAPREDDWTSHSTRTTVEGWIPTRREVAKTTLIEALVLEAERPLEKRFREQPDKWARETEHLSSPTQMMMHPSYQAVLGMAFEHKEDVIRLLLRDLRDNRREWFWALSYLTQDNPISSRDAGKMDKMIDAWVKWGKGRGLL